MQSSTGEFKLSVFNIEFSALLVLLLLVLPSLTFAKAYFGSVLMTPKLMSEAVKNYIDRLYHQSSDGFYGSRSGEKAARCLSAATSALQVVTISINLIFYTATFFIAISVYLFSSSSLMLVPIIFWAASLALLFYHFIPKLQKRSEFVSRSYARLNDRLSESFLNEKAIRIFDINPKSNPFLKRSISWFEKSNRGNGIVNLQISFYTALLQSVIIASLISMAILSWRSGDSGPGLVAIAFAASQRLAGMTSNLVWVIYDLLQEMGALNDAVSEFHDDKGRKLVNHSDIEMMEVPLIDRDSFQFREVSYSVGGTNILKNVSFSFNLGSKIAFVGPSGSGKSSIIELLCGLKLPSSGVVHNKIYNGQRDKNLDYNIFSFSSHMPYIFSGTLRENLKLGSPQASDEELQTALNLACCSGIPLLPGSEKFDLSTKIGGANNRFSNGQEQRIALTRALLTRAPVLILDEATSGLDRALANQVFANVINTSSTLILVTHDFTNLKKIDTIFYVKDGEVIEQGSHQSLLDLRGAYAEEYNARQIPPHGEG